MLLGRTGLVLGGQTREPGGNLGSQAIAKSYESEGAKVKGMIQMDMTGKFRAPRVWSSSSR